MKQLITISLAFFLLQPLPALAEIKTITHTVQQPFGGSQSPDDARTAGIARAKREALEQFGTYIESVTIVKESRVDSDEILALTAGVTKAEVIKQKNYTDGDGFGLEITVKVELDTAVLEKSLKRLLQDRNHLKDLKASREREKKLLVRITELEKQNKKKGKTKQQTEKLKQDFKDVSQGLTAVDWYNKADALWDGDKYTDPERAIEYLNHSISLASNYSNAHNNRGLAYQNLQQYQLALVDYSQAIRLAPKDSAAYINRGAVYASLKQHQNAIADYNQAMMLAPSDALIYNNLGITYTELLQFQKAIKEFDQAVKLDPNYAEAYGNRGVAYSRLNQFRQALLNFNQYVKLAANDVKAYEAYIARANCFSDLQQYEEAIEDYEQAIRLYPRSPFAFNNRGRVLISTGKIKLGCSDLAHACKLGACLGYEAARQDGECQ
jgi:tetratricopeptide (TPR) repeat protein